MVLKRVMSQRRKGEEKIDEEKPTKGKETLHEAGDQKGPVKT